MTHEEIIAAVESMTVLELADLVKAMEEKFGVSAAATAVVAGPAAGAAAPAAEEKTEFDVVLKSFDAAAKLKVLKLVREVCGLGLKEAKDFVEAVAAGPKTVKEGLSKEDADKLAAQFKEVGGECEIKQFFGITFRLLAIVTKSKEVGCLHPASFLCYRHASSLFPLTFLHSCGIIRQEIRQFIRFI